MSKERKLQVRVDENDERCIDINMKRFRISNKSEAMRKSSRLIATLDDYFQENGSLEVLDREGKKVIILPI